MALKWSSKTKQLLRCIEMFYIQIATGFLALFFGYRALNLIWETYCLIWVMNRHESTAFSGVAGTIIKRNKEKCYAVNMLFLASTLTLYSTTV